MSLKLIHHQAMLFDPCEDLLNTCWTLLRLFPWFSALLNQMYRMSSESHFLSSDCIFGNLYKTYYFLATSWLLVSSRIESSERISHTVPSALSPTLTSFRMLSSSFSFSLLVFAFLSRSVAQLPAL